MESPISNACYAVGDSDGYEGERATIESFIYNACHAVGSAVVSNGFGDSNFARIFVRVFIRRTSLVSYCDVVIVKIVVVDAIYFEVVCPEACGSKKCPEKKKKFSHNCMNFKG